MKRGPSEGDSEGLMIRAFVCVSPVAYRIRLEDSAWYRRWPVMG